MTMMTNDDDNVGQDDDICIKFRCYEKKEKNT